MNNTTTSLLLGLSLAVTAVCAAAQDTSDGGDSYTPVSLTLGSKDIPDRTLAIYSFLGAGFPIGGADVPAHESRSIIRDGNGTAIEVKDRYLNYGYGLKIDAGVDYLLMENLSLQAGVVWSGSVPRLRITYESPSDTWTETYHRAIFGLKAAVRPEFRVLELLDMYTTFGAGLFFSTLSIENDDDDYVAEGYIKTKPAIAFLGGLGANWPVTDMFSLVGELFTEQMSFKTKERRTTDPDDNPVQSERNSEVLNSDVVEPPTKIPGSNWGLKVGIRYWIY